MDHEFETLFGKIRQELNAQYDDIDLVETTEYGVVKVKFSEQFCLGELKRLLLLLDIERNLRGQFPSVKIVTEA